MLIPEAWLKGLYPLQKRIICHWTVTGYKPDSPSLDSYHFVIDGDGKVHRGYRDIDTPAPHTFGFNSSIGISLACMGGWDGESTPYPPTEAQWNSLVECVRQLCDRYSIPITQNSVLMHGEVDRILGVDQDGKWDIGYLPHLGIHGNTNACGSVLRQSLLAEPAPVEVAIRLQGQPTVFYGILQDAKTYVRIRDFVKWVAEVEKHKAFKLEEVFSNLVVLGFEGQEDTKLVSLVNLKGVGYCQVQPISDMLGLTIKIEKWNKDSRIIVMKEKE